MYWINKIVGFLANPAFISAVGMVGAFIFCLLRAKRSAKLSFVVSVLWLWGWSTPLLTKLVGASLEKEWFVDEQVPAIGSYPSADIIELHGGGMGIATNVSLCAEMWFSADRVWHAARLWKAGKAPKILVTSGSTDLTTGPLLADLGVPKEAIIYDFGPRNTEEEAKAVAVHCSTSTLNFASTRPKVLVVTSAWHMRRTMLMYEKYARNVEAIPAPCDFENTLLQMNCDWWRLVLPDAGALMNNSVALHECIGYWGYKIFR